MSILTELAPRAQQVKRGIVLPEGHDPRVIKAATVAAAKGVCRPIVIAAPAALAQAERQAGVTLAEAGITAIDPSTSDLLPELVAAFYEKRKDKGVSLAQAREIVATNELYFGNMLVALGRAQGLVAGAVASTGELLRSAFHCIGTAPGIKRASSCFLMDLQTKTLSGDKSLIFADCGVNPNPNAEELVDIAHATALTYQNLVTGTPRLAFLSFSTKGSAQHELVDKMRRATELTRQRFAELGFDAAVDGELQGDAALVPAVGAVKNRNGTIQGDANILIFPDLQAGNIAYKLVERLAGATAYGPILQGLAKPINDLSRGCSPEDIFGMICVTALQ